MPLTQIIHITAQYSNAVLVAMLPHVNDYATKLELPIPLPITQEQVQTFKVGHLEGYVAGGLWLTNDYCFTFGNGYIWNFKVFTNNPWLTENPAGDWGHYIGKMNMTTNEAITFARDELVKLGYDPKALHADVAPTSFEGGNVLPQGPFPYCQIKWRKEAKTIEEKADASAITVQVNMQDKTLLGLTVISPKVRQPEPDIEPKPELESDYRKRMQGTNAPPN